MQVEREWNPGFVIKNLHIGVDCSAIPFVPSLYSLFKQANNIYILSIVSNQREKSLNNF